MRVLGITRPDAVAAVDGVPVEISADGSFQSDLILEEGANAIEVVATDLSGDITFQELVVFFIPPTTGLPFTVFYPPDDLEVTEPTIPVVGGTRADAVVAVNGVPVEINALGIFSTTLSLDEGANFIEVVAADIQDNTRFETAVIFYLP